MTRRTVRRRERGATFTLFVIIFAVLLLAAATAFLEPAQANLKLTGERERRAVAREAALAGLDLARATAIASVATHGRCEARLVRARVLAPCERGESGLRVESVATTHPGSHAGTGQVIARARAVVRDGRLSDIVLSPR